MESLEQLPRPLSRANLAIDAIRKAILAGTFAPGQPLVERTLAAQLGVSKTPIREALRSLENNGLVQSHPSRGMVVRHVNPELVEKLYEFRLLLEPTAVRLSVPHQTRAPLQQARKTLEAGRRLGDQHVLSELSRLNRTFHELLYEPCPNDLLRSALSVMSDQLALVAASGWRAKPTWELEGRQHEAILEAVVEGDADKAGELTHEHITSARSRLLAAFG